MLLIINQIMEIREFQLKELNFIEQVEVNGGSLTAILAALAIMGAVIYLYEEGVPDFIEGFKEGYQSTQKET